MYALRLRYLTNLSKQSRQQRQQQSRHSVHLFPAEAWCSFSPIYSKRALIAHTRVKRNEPNASVPIWYLNVHQKPFQTSASPGIPSESAISFLLKYQVALAQITANSLQAIIKAVIQTNPRVIPAIIQLVPDDLITFLD